MTKYESLQRLVAESFEPRRYHLSPEDIDRNVVVEFIRDDGQLICANEFNVEELYRLIHKRFFDPGHSADVWMLDREERAESDEEIPWG